MMTQNCGYVVDLPTKPEPNRDPIPFNGNFIYYQICSCCKEPKERFFIKNENGEILGAALSWENVAKIIGKNNDKNNK